MKQISRCFFLGAQQKNVSDSFLAIVLIHFLRFRLSNNLKVDFEHICDAGAILSIGTVINYF
jgi:hypothetical protein